MTQGLWEYIVAVASECECCGDKTMASMYWERAARAANTVAQREWCEKRARACREMICRGLDDPE